MASETLDPPDRARLPDLNADVPDWLKRPPAPCRDEPLKVARDLRSVIEAGAPEGERLGYVTPEVTRTLFEAGMWGLRVPRCYGGSEVNARTYFDVMEELSYADGSTGWMVMASGFTSGGAADLAPEASEAIYNGGQGYIISGQVSSLGRAERVDGGYRVQGSFHFGSGSHYASWFLGAFILHEGDKPVLNEHGKPKLILCTAPRGNVGILGNWDVMGLAASCSYDYDILDQIIPEGFVRGMQKWPSRVGPFHAVGVSIGHMAWALGVGQRALDEIHALAKRKRRFIRPTLIDQPAFQRRYGENLAAVQASRALLHQIFDEWEEAARHGPVSLELRARARLASCWATDVTLKACQFAQFAAGSDGIRNQDANVLQRAFRDMQVGATHRHIDGDILIEAAQVALGVNDPLVEL